MPKNEFDKIKDKISAEEFRDKQIKSRQKSLAKSRKMQKNSKKKNSFGEPYKNISDTSSECSYSSVSTESGSTNNSRRSSKSSISSSSSTLFKDRKRWNSDTAHYEKDRTTRPAEHVHGISKEELNKLNLKGRG